MPGISLWAPAVCRSQSCDALNFIASFVRLGNPRLRWSWRVNALNLESHKCSVNSSCFYYSGALSSEAFLSQTWAPLKQT